MAWIIAWMAGGLIGKLKGCLLGLAGATACAYAVPRTRAADKEKEFTAYIHHAAVVLGTAWLAARAFGVPEPVMLAAGAYFATLLVCERVHIVLWDAGMRFPWMKEPLHGVRFSAGCDLRKRLPPVLWRLLVAVAIGFAAVWTLDAFVGWLQALQAAARGRM